MTKNVLLSIALPALLHTVCFGFSGEDGDPPLKSAVQITPRPAVLNTPGKNLQPVSVEIHHSGIPSTAKITLEGNLIQIPLTPGYNVADIAVEAGERERTAIVEILLDGQTEKRTITIPPVRKWKVNFV